MPVGGITQSKTMKMKASLCGVSGVAMIDNGASHNFVSKQLIA